eukprot:9146080-Pyramimonas_sp.AAC.1
MGGAAKLQEALDNKEAVEYIDEEGSRMISFKESKVVWGRPSNCDFIQIAILVGKKMASGHKSKFEDECEIDEDTANKFKDTAMPVLKSNCMRAEILRPPPDDSHPAPPSRRRVPGLEQGPDRGAQAVRGGQKGGVGAAHENGEALG